MSTWTPISVVPNVRSDEAPGWLRHPVVIAWRPGMMFAVVGTKNAPDDIAGKVISQHGSIAEARAAIREIRKTDPDAHARICAYVVHRSGGMFPEMGRGTSP